MVKTLVRHAVSADFPVLLDIDKTSFPPGIAYDSAELSYFMRREGAQTLVAESNGEIIGFLLMEMAVRRKSATMITLDVQEAHRRRGCASELLSASETILRENNIERYDLQVDVANSAAIEFYIKHGFEKTRLLRYYYPNGHDAYVMMKNL